MITSPFDEQVQRRLTQSLRPVMKSLGFTRGRQALMWKRSVGDQKQIIGVPFKVQNFTGTRSVYWGINDRNVADAAPFYRANFDSDSTVSCLINGKISRTPTFDSNIDSVELLDLFDPGQDRIDELTARLAGAVEHASTWLVGLGSDQDLEVMIWDHITGVGGRQKIWDDPNDSVMSLFLAGFFAAKAGRSRLAEVEDIYLRRRLAADVRFTRDVFNPLRESLSTFVASRVHL